MNAESIWEELRVRKIMKIPGTHGARRVVAKLRKMAERLDADLSVAYDSRRREYILLLDVTEGFSYKPPKIPPISLF